MIGWQRARSADRPATFASRLGDVGAISGSGLTLARRFLEDGHRYRDGISRSILAVTDFERLVEDVRACRVCTDLPLGPRPVFQLSQTACILVAGQAPGTKVHVSGVPFNDPSGERLRAWMGVSREEFYAAERVAILPMALCYPGRAKGGGDAPPRPECALRWRALLLDQLPAIRLTLLIGTYSQKWALGPGTVTDRVRNFHSYLPDRLPLPHPSWRSTIWVQKNPWFEAEVLPALRAAVREVLG